MRIRSISHPPQISHLRVRRKTSDSGGFVTGPNRRRPREEVAPPTQEPGDEGYVEESTWITSRLDPRG